MSERVCGCGFVAAGPGELTDHLFEVFLPEGDVGPDGVVHAEDAHDNRACRAAPLPPKLRNTWVGWTATLVCIWR
jgi:hypothetical protein